MLNIKIIALVSIVIIGLVGGTAAALKIFYKPEINKESGAISVIIKANGLADAALVSYNSTVNLRWESDNASRCFASGGWSGILSASGSQTIENVKIPDNYHIKCINDKNGSALSSVIVRIDENTIPPEARAAITRDFFKDFTYAWKNNFCLNAKNESDVIALQTVLFLERFFDSADKITGVFNDETSTALKKFQEAYDIEQTGCAGQKTISKLNELYGVEILAYSSGPPSSGSPSNPQLISGLDFKVNELVRTTATVSLRDEKCREIGTVPAGTLLKIISSEIKYCVIGAKKFQMRNVWVINTGQTGWVLAAYLERASNVASGGSNNVPDNKKSTATASSTAPAPAVSVNLKANGFDGSSVSVSPGSSAILSWTSTSTVSCEASGGNWSGPKQISGTESTEVINSRDNIRLYILQCRGNNGVYVSDRIGVMPSLSTSTSPTNLPAQGTPKIDKLNPNKWDINPFCVPSAALTVNIIGSGFAPHDNELDTGWGVTVKNLDSKDGKNIVAKIKNNDELIKKVQKEKYKINYATFKWKITNPNGTSNEKDFVAFSSCNLW